MTEENMETEKKRCLEIFPNEIWESILSKVKQVSDYFKISSSSSHLRTILLKYRASEILFPVVASSLLQKFSKLKVRYISKEITVLRRVCSEWRRGVDEVLQDPDDFDDAPMISGDDVSLPDNQVDKFYVADDYSDFEQHFDTTHLAKCNPFLGRRVFFSFGENREQNLEEVYRACSQLLTKYGYHVWCCIIHLGMLSPLQRLAFYNRLPGFLSLMPNLQGLELFEFFADAFHIPDNVRVEGPFPELPHLRHLYLYGPHLPVVRGIVTRSPRITQLFIVGPQSGETVTYMQLPNIQVLYVVLHERDQTFQTFRRAQFASRSVKRFQLNISAMNGTVSWKTTFRLLQTRFLECLQHLVLTLHQPKAYDDFLRTGLRLEKLKALELELEVPVPLDFILPMANHLEKIILFSSAEEETKYFQAAKRAETTVKVYQFWRRLEKSNAWRIFPRLRLMIAKTENGQLYSCTRNKWLAVVENRQKLKVSGKVSSK